MNLNLNLLNIKNNYYYRLNKWKKLNKCLNMQLKYSLLK